MKDSDDDSDSAAAHKPIQAAEPKDEDDFGDFGDFDQVATHPAPKDTTAQKVSTLVHSRSAQNIRLLT